MKKWFYFHPFYKTKRTNMYVIVILSIPIFVNCIQFLFGNYEYIMPSIYAFLALYLYLTVDKFGSIRKNRISSKLESDAQKMTDEELKRYVAENIANMYVENRYDSIFKEYMKRILSR